jgi:hypothetical protein
MAAEDFPEALFKDRVTKTDEDILAAAWRVVKNESTSKTEGYTGLCILYELLPYVSPLNLWLMPVAHALLKGTVSNFLDLVLSTLPTVSL